MRKTEGERDAEFLTQVVALYPSPKYAIHIRKSGLFKRANKVFLCMANIKNITKNTEL